MAYFRDLQFHRIHNEHQYYAQLSLKKWYNF